MRRSVVETGFLGSSPKRRIKRVGGSAPLRWISGGAVDLLGAPVQGLASGTVLAALCYLGIKLALISADSTLGYLGGLLFLIPFLASAVFVVGREKEKGRFSGFVESLKPVWSRKAYLTLFAIMMAALSMGWLRLSALMFSVFLDIPELTLMSLQSAVSSGESLIPFAVIAIVSFMGLVVLFFGSVVALPLVLDGDAEFVNAMITSFQTVKTNPGAMSLWAGLAFVLMAIGIATWFIGLALVFPLLCFAAWRSYRDLIA